MQQIAIPRISDYAINSNSTRRIGVKYTESVLSCETDKCPQLFFAKIKKTLRKLARKSNRIKIEPKKKGQHWLEIVKIQPKDNKTFEEEINKQKNCNKITEQKKIIQVQVKQMHFLIFQILYSS